MRVPPEYQPQLAEIVDPRGQPAYSIREAAHYLRMPVPTIRAWTMGTTISIDGSRRVFNKVIDLPIDGLAILSFFNLAEIAVLRGLREQYGIKLDVIRSAIDYVKAETGWSRPLVQEHFRTDGRTLFIQRMGELVDVAAPDQLLLPGVLDSILDRIEWREQLASRLYVLTRTSAPTESPRTIAIDPRFCFGRPMVASRGIATDIIYGRFQAGDDRDLLRQEFDLTDGEIDEAIRCEAPSAIAA